MPLSDDPCVSLTVKTRSGDLFTVRGATAAEFNKNVAEVIGLDAMGAANALFEAAQGVPAPVPHGEAAVPEAQPVGHYSTPTVAPAAYTPPWQDAGPQQLPGSMTPACENCGAPMRYEEWTGKQGKNAGKQFKAWKCTRDKDHKVNWVN
jgi:hypothetical protein